MNCKIGTKVRFTQETLERFRGTSLKDKVLTIIELDWTKNCPIRLNTLDVRAGAMEYFTPEELQEV